MRILIAGDTHGKQWIERTLEHADKQGAAHAIVVGDCWDVHIDYSPKFKAKPHYIMGNHEQPLYWEVSLKHGEAKPNFSTFEIDGVKFGVIGLIDEDSHQQLRQEIPWLYDALGPKPDIWMKKLPVAEVAERFKGIDVLLVHDAPYPMHFKSFEGEQKLSGSKYLAEIVEAVKPKYCFGGHFHRYYRRTIGETDCIQLDMQGGWGYNKVVLDTDTMNLEFFSGKDDRLPT